jgi:hypothetical protein
MTCSFLNCLQWNTQSVEQGNIEVTESVKTGLPDFSLDISQAARRYR